MYMYTYIRVLRFWAWRWPLARFKHVTIKL